MINRFIKDTNNQVDLNSLLYTYVYANVSNNVSETPAIVKYNKIPFDKQIEYLKTLGNGDCYIDIPLIHNANFKREFEFKKENTNSKYDLVVQSISNSTSFLFWSANTATFYTYYSGKEFNFNISVTSQNKKVKVIAQQPNITVDINGTITNQTFNIQQVYTSNKIRLFSERTDRVGIISIYYFKIWDENNNILLDLIPVRVGQVGYMYDKLSGQLFGNSGTGSFVLGPDI